MSYERAKALMAKGVSRPTLYRVNLPIGSKAREFAEFYCKATSIPDVRLETASINGQENMGIVRQQPTSMIFGKPFSMTILESKEFNVYKELRDWMNTTTMAANQEVGQSRNQRMFYYDQYVRDFTLFKIEQPDRQDQSTYDVPLVIKFIRAYPVSISAVSLASDSFDVPTEFTVDFTYESYSIENPRDYE